MFYFISYYKARRSGFASLSNSPNDTNYEALLAMVGVMVNCDSAHFIEFSLIHPRCDYDQITKQPRPQYYCTTNKINFFFQ